MEILSLYPALFKTFKGTLNIIPSKSIANRALLLQALSLNSFEIKNLGEADDVMLMKKALLSKDKNIDIGLAGTAMRFLTSGFSVLDGVKILDGHQRLRERPIKPLVDALKSLGAQITHLEKDGFLPIEIKGNKLQGSHVKIEQNHSSQFVSALMLIAPFLPNGLLIERSINRKSESYIDLTKDIMNDIGFEVDKGDTEISIAKQKSTISSYTVEGDWSSAAYWMAFVTLIPHSQLILSGLKKSSRQGDKSLLDILYSFGLRYQWKHDNLILHHALIDIPSRFEYDCSDIPDQAQTIAFLCAALGVDAKLHGLETLVYKESNRIKALANELNKIGLKVKFDIASISIEGKIDVDDVEIETYNDHRMAMAASLLAVKMNVTILSPDVVSKSYPSYWKDLAKLTIES